MARLAAAYLDMWEQVASAHALRGPPAEADKPGKADGTPND